MIVVTLMLGIFNMLPIPPLDGSKILALILPGRMYHFFVEGGWWSMMAIMVLVFTGLLSNIISPLLWWVLANLIMPFYNFLLI